MRSVLYKLLFGLLTTVAIVSPLVAYNLNGFSYTAADVNYRNIDDSDGEQDGHSHESHGNENGAAAHAPDGFQEKWEIANRAGYVASPEELLGPRTLFAEKLAAAKEVLILAEQTSDVEYSREIIEEAEQKVSKAENNPGTILFETDKVMRETGRLWLSFLPQIDYLGPNRVVAVDDALTDTDGLLTLPSYHPARVALDAMGGTDIKLGTASSVCGPSNEAMACAYDNNVILLDDEYADADYDFLYDAMMHEYAHEIQFDYRVAMESSVGYTELFDSSYEWIADCMSAARIPGYQSGYMHECSAEQLTYGENAWNGVFH